MWTTRSCQTLTALLVAAIGSITMIAAQSTTTARAESLPSTDQLLLEVRELKTEIHQAVNSSIRAQLLIARLQLQEQRVNALAGQLSEIRRLLKNADSSQAPIQMKLRQLEDAAQSTTFSPEAQRAMETELPQVRMRLEQMQQQEQQLRTWETELANQLASEQSRWIDFNSRLDELERQLPSNREATIPTGMRAGASR